MGFRLETNIPTGNSFKPINEIKVGDIVYNRFGLPVTVTKVTKQKKQSYEIKFTSNETITVSQDTLLTVYDDSNKSGVDTVKVLADNLDEFDLFVNTSEPIAFEGRDVDSIKTNVTSYQNISDDVLYNDTIVRNSILQNIKRNSKLYQDDRFVVKGDNENGLSKLIQLISSLGFVPIIFNYEAYTTVISSCQPRRQIESIEKSNPVVFIDIETDEPGSGLIVGDNCFVFELAK